MKKILSFLLPAGIGFVLGVLACGWLASIVMDGMLSSIVTLYIDEERARGAVAEDQGQLTEALLHYRRELSARQGHGPCALSVSSQDVWPFVLESDDLNLSEVQRINVGLARVRLAGVLRQLGYDAAAADEYEKARIETGHGARALADVIAGLKIVADHPDPKTELQYLCGDLPEGARRVAPIGTRLSLESLSGGDAGIADQNPPGTPPTVPNRRASHPNAELRAEAVALLPMILVAPKDTLARLLDDDDASC